MDFPVDLSAQLLALARDLGIKPEDIEEQFVRGSGKGGQKINKTSSTVHLIHKPTGLEVRVQKHREQHKNRLSAWKLLIYKVEEKIREKESKLAQEKCKIRKQKRRRSRKAKEKMLADKHHHSELKEARKRIV